MPESNKALYVCQRCALNAPTCCRLGAPADPAAEDQADLARAGYSGADCFPLSRAEHERIAEAIAEAKGKGSAAGRLLLQNASQAADAARGKAGWAVDEPNSSGFVQAMCNLFPREGKRVREVFPAGGAHLRLALRPGGVCAFLSEVGCVLPRRARPWFCRLFPFWVVAGKVQCFQDEQCLAVREHGGNFMALMRAFGTSPPDIAERYRQLRDDWGI